jgi:uncharacterized membrane protein
MSKFVVVIFPNETKAYEGTRALKELHAEASLAVYAVAVVTKGADGKLSVKEAADNGPLGMGVGALVGGLTGLLGGPVGAAMGIGVGAFIGSFGDLFNMGVGTDFLDKVSKELSPGKSAIVAEVAEDWVTPLDTRMGAIGGTVVREWRTDFEDEMIEKDVKARKAEIAQLKEEFSHASGEAKAKLTARIEEARARLRKATDWMEAQISRLQRGTDAQISVLQGQAAKTTANAKAKIDQRISELRAEHERRSAKLKQAWKLTKEALAA